jgi:diguanylate cyclase (GGDEF)-like protein/PAS domain S-box-containing protein
MDNGARIQFFQFYVGTAVLLILPVAALLKHNQELLVRLSASEARHDLISRHVSDAILNLSVDGTILYASPAFRLLGGYDPEMLVGRNACDLVYSDDMEQVIEAHRAALREPGRTTSVEYRAARSTGALTWFENRTRAVIGEGGTPVGVVSAIRDITEKKQAEFRLLEAANTDALTGLHNRRAFMDMLDLRWRRVRDDQGRCAVVIFDIDHFKHVNDMHGHATGDLVLKAFAETARGALRDTDMLARIGGEEFALLLWGDDAAGAARVAERILNATEHTIIQSDEGKAVSVTVSAGVAEVGGSVEAQEALKAADDALYRAKAAGRNCLRLVA